MKNKLSKQQKVLIDVVLLIVAFAVFGWLIANGFSKGVTQMRQIVAVENGHTVSKPITNSFELNTKGKQVIAVKWWSDEKPGFVTGLVVTDPTGEEIFACTGDKVDILSNSMKLEKGTYEITLTFLSSPEEMNSFILAHNLGEVIGDEFTDYKENGEWLMEYSVEFRSAFGLGHVAISVLMGVIIGLLLVRLFWVISKTGNQSKLQYDERQEMVRGRAYKYGFFTFLIYYGLMAVLSAAEIQIPAKQSVLLLVGIFISIAVMVTYSIWRDGYFALNENRKVLLVIFCVVAGINFWAGMNNIHLGTTIKDGRLALGSINFFCCGLFLYIFVLLAAKAIVDKKEENA